MEDREIYIYYSEIRRNFRNFLIVPEKYVDELTEFTAARIMYGPAFKKVTVTPDTYVAAVKVWHPFLEYVPAEHAGYVRDRTAEYLSPSCRCLECLDLSTELLPETMFSRSEYVVLVASRRVPLSKLPEVYRRLDFHRDVVREDGQWYLYGMPRAFWSFELFLDSLDTQSPYTIHIPASFATNRHVIKIIERKPAILLWIDHDIIDRESFLFLFAQKCPELFKDLDRHVHLYQRVFSRLRS
jgi:hypothetical protein